MDLDRPALGCCFDRTFPPGLVLEFARRLEAGGADQLWLIEDCFYTAGVSLAAAALAVTERLQVGLGILPAVARNPAVTAMEVATLAGLGPGRVLAGIGHGMQDWMAQMGAATPSPVTTLEEVLIAVRRLLAGERVTTHGRYVHLDEVALDQPPVPRPPVLAGVRGPRSLAMAGRAADGVVLADPACPSYVRWAAEQAGAPPGFHVAVFSSLCVAGTRRAARAAMAPWLASHLDAPSVGLAVLPFITELTDWYRRRGVDGLVDAPDEWWAELGPIGTLDDALAHLDELRRAGVHSIGLFPPPDAETAREQLDHVVALAGAWAPG